MGYFDPFVFALIIAGGLLLLELVTMLIAGISTFAAIDGLLSIDNIPEGNWDNWLIIRGIPLSVVIVLLCCSFACIGYCIQEGWFGVFGKYLNPALVSVVALYPSILITRIAGNAIKPIFEGSSTAVSKISFLGHTAEICSVNVRKGTLGEAKYKDAHGHIHYLIVTSPNSDLMVGDKVLLESLNADSPIFVVAKMY